MTMPGASRALRAAGAGAALAGLTAGLPAVLYAAGGTPLPHAAMSWHQLIAAAARPDSPAVVLGAVRAISWLAWAAFTACAAAELTARLRRRTARQVPGLAPLQGLAAVLVTAVLAGTTAVPAAQAAVPRPAAASPRAAPRPRPWPARPQRAVYQVRPGDNLRDPAAANPGNPDAWHRIRALNNDQPQPGGPAADRDISAVRPRTYRVVPGDDLWEIAERFLGNGERWHEIFRLNAGRPQPDGRTLTDPNLIYSGWILLLAPPGSHHDSPPAHHHQAWSRARAEPVALPAAPPRTPRQHTVPDPGQPAPAGPPGRRAPALGRAHRDVRRGDGRRRGQPGQHPAPPPLPPPPRPGRHACTRPGRRCRPSSPPCAAPPAPPRPPPQTTTPARTPAPRPSPIPTSTPTATTPPARASPAQQSPTAAPPRSREPPARPRRPHRRAPARRPPASPARSRSASAGPARPPSTSPPSAGSA